MNRLTYIEIIFTAAIAMFFVISEHLIKSTTKESLLGFAASASIMLLAVCIPLIIVKFAFLKMRLSEIAEHRAPIHSPYYRSTVIVTAVQSLVSMFTISVSTYAMAMSLFVAFGVNSAPFLHALHLDHAATYAIFPALDVIYLVSSDWKRK